ncbi:hypothetical protein D6764_01815 [Candidatus Woesearchaeota archaeon]|nr:MAG: hypothetical protein D6764_01815 [Candidatus Woesearchaeota archaeon]
MKDKKYASILLFIVLSILGVLYLASPLSPEFFLKESGLIVVLLIASAIVLYGISREVAGAYAGSSLLFSVILFNLVYLYVEGSRENAFGFSHYFMILLLVGIGIFGFFFSLERVGSLARERRARKELSRIAAQLRELRSKSEVIARELKSLEETSPKVIVEEIKSSEKKSLRKSGNAGAKSTAKGKAEKKATTAKAAKARSGKSGRGRAGKSQSKGKKKSKPAKSEKNESGKAKKK